jgi:TRAP-type C4-dicarboxylate transport system permease small subunit
MGQLVSQGSSAVAVLGQAGMAAKMAGGSITAMLGPIGMATVAVFQLAQAFRNYGDKVNKVNARVEAYKASLSEMTANYEILAAKQEKYLKKSLKTYKS